MTYTRFTREQSDLQETILRPMGGGAPTPPPLNPLLTCDAEHAAVHSNKHLIFGMDDGCVRVQPIHNDDPGLMGPYWSLSMHDNDCGTVTQLASSFDDKYIFSVGRDGNFFAFAVIDDKRFEQDAAQSTVKVPSAKVGIPPGAPGRNGHVVAVAPPTVGFVGQTIHFAVPILLMKIIETAVARWLILKLKFTKFDFGWGSAQDPAGGAYIAPQTPSWI